MDDRELRFQTLALAMELRSEGDDADVIVASAQKFFEFVANTANAGKAVLVSADYFKNRTEVPF